MSKVSKEENILSLFFNEPTKYWQFKGIVKTAKISEQNANVWLKKMITDNIIRRIKPKKKMPYYVGNWEHPNYQNKKKIFASLQLYESGFLNHLASLDVKAVIIFGSFSRWDWYSKSDIDLFIYGDVEKLKIGKYEMKLHREIQLFHVETEKDLKKFGNGLLKNIVRGNIIKGNINFLEVKAHAKI